MKLEKVSSALILESLEMFLPYLVIIMMLQYHVMKKSIAPAPKKVAPKGKAKK